MAERVSQGTARGSARDPLNSARVVNDILAAKDDYIRRRAMGLAGGRIIEPRDTNIIRVKNDSGAARLAGEALEISAGAFTALRPDAPWMAGDLRANVGPFGILTESVGDGKFCRGLQLAGHCMALIDILDADHTHCYVKTGDANPQSNFGGPWRIVWKPTGTGNAQPALLLLGDPCYTRKAKPDTTLTAGSYADCSFYIDGVDLGSERVYYDWMEAGFPTIASGTEMVVQWYDDEEKWGVLQVECQG